MSWRLTITVQGQVSYCDRERNPQKEKQNWTHIYNDVAVLESRHAFNDRSTDIALGLLEIYFPVQIVDIIKDKNNWLHDHNADLTVVRAGIIGDRKIHLEKYKCTKRFMALLKP